MTLVRKFRWRSVRAQQGGGPECEVTWRFSDEWPSEFLVSLDTITGGQHELAAPHSHDLVAHDVEHTIRYPPTASARHDVPLGMHRRAPQSSCEHANSAGGQACPETPAAFHLCCANVASPARQASSTQAVPGFWPADLQRRPGLQAPGRLALSTPYSGAAAATHGARRRGVFHSRGEEYAQERPIADLITGTWLQQSQKVCKPCKFRTARRCTLVRIRACMRAYG